MDTRQVTRDENGTMRCRECGFPYALAPGEVADRADQAMAAVDDAVRAAPLTLRGRRPAPDVWSVNAYTAHLAEAALVIDGRIRRMAQEDRPALAAYDQDHTAAEGRFDERPADASLATLRETVAACTVEMRSLSPERWQRTGLHAEAGEVRLSDIAHDLAHELEHHAADIRRVGAQVTQHGRDDRAGARENRE